MFPAGCPSVAGSHCPAEQMKEDGTSIAAAPGARIPQPLEMDFCQIAGLRLGAV